MTPARDPKKFDPARAHLLDAPEREAYLPDAALVSMLELAGTETVVDYGAGTGRVAAAVADALPDGRVIAVDESEEMLAHLRANPAAARVEPLLAVENATGLADACADRVLAVNLLHEVRGESALTEMRRLLAPGGFALVVDWERGRGRDNGPPDDLRYGAEEAAAELAAAGLTPTRVTSELPFHFAFRAERSAPDERPSR